MSFHDLMFTDLTAGTAVPEFPTGWEAQPSNSVTFNVPDNWKAGRIWGRRDCDFTITNGPTCLDGWCNGGLLCDPHTGTGVPPATVAEWTLQGDGNRDFYDVSLVDGYNLPVAITTSANCPIADCPVDLGPNCPAPLIGPFDSTNFPVGCKSACNANLDGNPSVQYYDYFKGNCPNSYAYAFDESSGTALWTCDSGLNADYTLTFCPTITPANAASASNVVASSGPSIPGATSPSPVSVSAPSAATASSQPPAIVTAGNSTNITGATHPNSAISLEPLHALYFGVVGIALSIVTVD
ncbi:hypothetical protein BN946_scf184969.g86 [Trametes cinnabarina]|uniref:Osmotin, thaumatin-like protein n=1 Tax=Pycnoporus cinnabarinus TaxID=5643 RepID=A0A060SZQ2_PYCCI|nr:hypothetical protein BN946_scf184969.g86 [Trametes cinnabarina]